MTGIRSMAKPSVSQVDPGKIPEPFPVELKNGLPVFLFDSGTEEIERIEFTFDAGNIRESVPLLASTVNLMLQEGTEKYRSVRLNRLLDMYCAFFQPYTDSDRAGIIICFMNKYAGKALELAREMLFFPLFNEKELKLLTKKRFQQYCIEREKVHRLASDEFFESIFGKNHPYGRTTVPDDFANIRLSDLAEFHSAFYKPENMAIIVSGKINEKLIDLLNEYFGGFSLKYANVCKSALSPKGEENRIRHISKPGSVQCAIRIGSSTINKRHPDYPGLKIVNMILGGYFGSRLMKNLREEKGYTYGISSSVISLNMAGYKSISAEVSKLFTQKAIDEIYMEIRQLQNEPIGKEELETVRNYMIGELVRMFDGPFTIPESFRSVWEFGLDNSYFYRLASKIKSIDPDEITELARTYYNIDDLYQITAG